MGQTKAGDTKGLWALWWRDEMKRETSTVSRRFFFLKTKNRPALMGQAVRSKMAAGKGRKKKNNGSRLSDKLPVMRGAELHNRQANHSTKRKGTPALYKDFFFFFGPRVVRSLAVFFFPRS